MKMTDAKRTALKTLAIITALTLTLTAVISAPVLAQQTQVTIDNATPTDGTHNPPVELSVDVGVADNTNVIVEIETAAGIILDVARTSGGTVTTTWDAEIGTHRWRAIVRTPDGTVLDATPYHEITVTNRDTDATCLETGTEIRDKDIWHAGVGAHSGELVILTLSVTAAVHSSSM